MDLVRNVFAFFHLRLHEVWANVASQALWAVLALAVIVVAILCAFSRERRARFTFFGIDRQNPKATIFLSNIVVRTSSALEPVEKGYQGSALSQIEYEAGVLIRERLTEKPTVIILEPVQDWLGLKIWGHRRVEVGIEPSPRIDTPSTPDAEIRPPDASASLIHSANISIGSPIYNSVTKWYLEQHLPAPDNAYANWFVITRCGSGERTIQFVHGRRPAEELPRDPPSEAGRTIEPAFVLRVNDGGRVVFLCAGIADWATAASVRYLGENWKALYRRMGNAEFGVALKCRRPDTVADPKSLPEELFLEKLK